MTQLEYDIISKIIRKGAPVLADELCLSLDNLVVERNTLAIENAELKAAKKQSSEAPVEA